MLLIYPEYNLSTKKVFSKFRKSSNISYKKSINFTNKEKLIEISKFYGNDLQYSALKIVPKLQTIIKSISKMDHIKLCSMTGSGRYFL